MKRFRITGQVTVTCVTEIDAANEKQALEIAKEMSHRVMIGGPDGGYDWSDGFFIEDGDGRADSFEVEEIEPVGEHE